ncbi:cupin domain-containing protein [Frateuria terrea]|uniref:Cupin domain-containing protein n=1 Tax=Frateuria terrea TaxID=529704 RepID=A0A1H6R4K9_9GAMM|nr:cupin domain-containing protein [Frateuria terrea]SEI50751.1 Cupin domain-containing protein [Frateuria terrea]SFP15744.1 Cupin domain-containing protein [Frateuria terrea]
MSSDYPSAEEYSAEMARYPAMTVVDIRSEHSLVTDSYKNQVLFNINGECMRLSVFEGQYRWHQHPDTDELFVVVAGELRIEFEDGARVALTEWQSIVIPAGTVHRTRAVGRTVNITCEAQNATTVFLEPPPDPVPPRGTG